MLPLKIAHVEHFTMRLWMFLLHPLNNLEDVVLNDIRVVTPRIHECKLLVFLALEGEEGRGNDVGEEVNDGREE